jgi:hypothetical protein
LVLHTRTMRIRTSTLVVVALVLTSAVLLGLELLFVALTRGSPVPDNLANEADVIEFSLAVGVFVVVGAVVAARRPRNPIGWILLAEGLLWQAMPVLAGYCGYALFTEPGGLPGAEYAAWLLEWAWVLPVGLIPFFFLLFPDGRLPSRRWRPVAWLALLAPLLVVIGQGLAPGPLESIPSVPNPLGIPGAEWLSTVAFVGESVLGALALLAAFASFLIRFRASRGLERQQFKWLAYATALLAASLMAGQVLTALGVSDEVTSNFNVLPLLGLPVAVGFAVLNNRLYDIDRIINRTLVYGVLTVLLAAVYAGGVVLLPQLIGSDSPLFTAGSTLLAAALFQPLRRLVQDAVDRRFNRRRYDAAKAIDGFSARLRHHVELDVLTTELLAVVDQTMEPTHASLWLRPAQQQPDGQSAQPAPAGPPGG